MALVPYYEHGGITIYHGDCREVLGGISFDAVVTDPPYGIGWCPRVNHQDSPWKDDERPDLSAFVCGKPLCVWGGNYFTDVLPQSESWLVWIKRPAGFDFDDDSRSYSVIEMAWTNFGGKPRMKNHCWDGGKRAGKPENRTFCHPAQKPIEVMQWCISMVPDEAEIILDPFMGSGATIRAAKDLGRKAIGIEIEERYCEIAANRLAQEVLFA